MKWTCVLVLFACACKEAPRPPPPSPSPPPASTAPAPAATTADAAVADTAASLVELARKVAGVTVRVSSQVKNPSIKPLHLIDRDMQTAWNSRTGDLVGAWIEVAAPGSRIVELRMTVGHTGKGRKGEDYFTMNPRITKIDVKVESRPTVTVALDPERRDLHVIPVDGEKVTITVAAIKPGSKRTWREIAVSELEAWGTPPRGWTAANAPLEYDVEVGYEIASDPCADLEERKADRAAKRRQDDAECMKLRSQEARDQCMTDPPGDPDCGSEPIGLANLVPPWREPTLFCEVYDDVYGPITCSVTAETNSGTALAVAPLTQGGHASLDVEAELDDVVKGGAPELVIRYKGGEDRDIDLTVVCRAVPLACTEPEAAATALTHPPSFR